MTADRLEQVTAAAAAGHTASDLEQAAAMVRALRGPWRGGRAASDLERAAALLTAAAATAPRKRPQQPRRAPGGTRPDRGSSGARRSP